MTFDNAYWWTVIVLVLLVIVLSEPVQAKIVLGCLADAFSGGWFSEWYYAAMTYFTGGHLACVY